MTGRERETHKRIREAEREWAHEEFTEQEEGPFRGEGWEEPDDIHTERT